MEETNTTDLSLSNVTSGYGDWWENLEYKCSRLPYGLMVFAWVCIGICLCGLVGNGKVMWFLGFHMKQNPFSVYILNLAVADFSLLLLVFLLILAFLSSTGICPYWHHIIYFYIDFRSVAEVLCHFFDLSSLGLLTAISMEQCICILFPVWYRCHRPTRVSAGVSGVLWALAACFVSSMYLSTSFAESYQMVFSDVAFAIAVVLLSVMLISSLFLFFRLCCGSQRRHPGKLYVAVLLNMIWLFALSIPFSVEVFLNLSSSQELFPVSSSLLLTLLDCCINPVIYFLAGSCWQRWFQGSVDGTFQQVFEEEEVREEESCASEDTVLETTV
ncbi:mas-related G-protein coupled receptor member D-like [Colius striatus]|uniref:mas-related G-protein coupled receptor member D-like n=1 Tax=Colius striatus TaxID=57412 RepID=UPI002B1CEE88|nr:mas-related G-protein coupled receptor member D-like [Colius striatus]